MTDEHPLMRKARAKLGLSTPVDGFDAMIDKINEGHYTDAAKPRSTRYNDVEVVITTKADIANSKHLASREALAKIYPGMPSAMLDELYPSVTAATSLATSCGLTMAYLYPGKPSRHAESQRAEPMDTEVNSPAYGIEQRLARIEGMIERLVTRFL